MELVDAVWKGIPEFHEHYELREGLFPQQIPMFDEGVVRELLVNTLVHRPYTQRGTSAWFNRVDCWLKARNVDAGTRSGYDDIAQSLPNHRSTFDRGAVPEFATCLFVILVA